MLWQNKLVTPYLRSTQGEAYTPRLGFERLMINSDARSGQTIEDRIRPALESGSAIGSKAPVLVVIDEVDGATGGDNVCTSDFPQIESLTLHAVW